ncbi:hypothetical protein [Pseudochryseolinea flava]|uniref:EF-hand domain-containing protein n=1 Tax=Pseudochryseolinea flava TaxID=2059302 RepID=A0A364Y7J3_9BACT|nr:hypothetical protein [Pseudochryseolinea flava]RAW02947.1 hypothetical protein DQQ10_02245 [Pseudochryseolinea flava]
MKKSAFIVYALLIAAASTAHGQNKNDSTGLPGDNFSLNGALELFKQSESPEEFEKKLNAEDSKVNNLDLNGDGEIDYIKVIDKADGDAHAFVLQAAVSENESQDIAVIEVEKESDEKATLQIIGDEDLYGEETIVEPTEKVKTNAGTTSSNVTVNVYTWPSVRYVYRPGYRVWVSPWGWHARPVWWRPWRPVHYHVFHPYHAHYRHRYAVVHTHRTVVAHRVYRPTRTTSVIVRTRHQEPVNRYRTQRVDRTTVIRHNDNRAVRKSTTTRRDNGARKGTTTKTVKRKSRSRD